MEQSKENRVTEELLDWTDKENRLRAVFGNDVIKGKDFLKSKRDFFDALDKSCRPGASTAEKVMLNVIKGETRKLDKLIYPNAAVRLIVKLVGKVKDGIQSYRQNHAIDKEMLSIQLKHKGVEYERKQNSKSRDQRHQLRESAKEALNTYKRKGGKTKSKSAEDQPLQKPENSLMPKKRLNPHNGRSI